MSEALLPRRAVLARLAWMTVPAGLAGCSDGALAMVSFDSIPQAVQTLHGLKLLAPRTTGAWDLAQVLHHAAQSVEYSIGGFPQPKPAWFRASVGPLAFAVFSSRGRMSHGLDEPIPGAPAIAAGQPLAAAVDRAIAALRAFEAHTGPLAPHFAYGTLSKPDFARAHLMHLANHWDEVAA